MEPNINVALLSPLGFLGHLIPFIELAKTLVSRPNCHVTLLVPDDGTPMKFQRSLLDGLPAEITTVFLPTDGQPEAGDAELLLPIRAGQSLPAIREALSKTPTPPAALVVDLFAPFAIDVARELGIPAYIFYVIGANDLSFSLDLPEQDRRCTSKFGPTKLPGGLVLKPEDLPDVVKDRNTDLYKAAVDLCKKCPSADGILVNSFHELESEAFRYLEHRRSPTPPVYAVGPLLRTFQDNESDRASACLRWLDDQPPQSVVFVSFGSGGTLSPEQTTELALGLEMSGQGFLWVVRSPQENAAAAYFKGADGRDPLGFLPEGFLERTKGRGLVVASWAPQIQVLSHPSTGGFVTHCGWNSILESAVHGVPMIAWPLCFEQRMKAVFLRDGVNCAIGVREGENGIVERDEVSSVVKRLMEGEEGKLIRNKMMVLKNAAENAMREDGSSAQALARVVELLRNGGKSTSITTVIESSEISPRPGGRAELSLPITFFDMAWYDFPANQCLLFFDFPCSKPHFFNSIVPHLKKSLSLTLPHFLPLAGNIIHPLNPQHKPLLRYVSTDSVSLTVSESDADFSHLIGNQPRYCDDFYAFAPRLPRAARSEISISCPVLALQVTLFPGKGLSIGFVSHHAVADASTIVSFIRAWAMITGIGPDEEGDVEARLREASLLPFFDRETVTNINGLDSVFWEEIVRLSCSVEPPPVKFPVNMLRATFVLRRDEIQKLKEVVVARSASGGAGTHVSSFTVVCALVWACSARSAAEEVAEDEDEYFGFTADCRGRLKPALPENYFGNCVALAKAELKHGQVKGDDGFVTAAEAIGAAVKGMVTDEKGILDGAENWSEEFGKLIGKRQFGVAGSPRFDFYAADFGWGKAKKFEALFIDGGASISLCKSRDYEGGLEIGLSKPKLQMDAFATVFHQLLWDLCHG